MKDENLLLFIPKTEHSGPIPMLLFHANKCLFMLPQGVFRTTMGGRKGVTKANGVGRCSRRQSPLQDSFLINKAHKLTRYTVVSHVSPGLALSRSSPVEVC